MIKLFKWNLARQSLKMLTAGFLAILTLSSFSGCAFLFGWKIHAPGILSQEFLNQIPRVEQRIALMIDPNLANAISEDRGGKFSDPQIYYVGESLEPMLLEGFSSVFSEFLLLEIEPSPELLQKYEIKYLVAIAYEGLENQVSLKGQVLSVSTHVFVWDQDLKLVDEFKARGESDARKVFAKKGGPEVNLNAAVENNILAILQRILDIAN